MATTTVTPNWGRIVRLGVVAGIVGAIVLFLFTFGADRAQLHDSLLGLGSIDAGYVHATPAWIGILLHFCVGVAWGIGYAYVADTRRYLSAHPWLSGIAFGLIVWVVMQLVLMAGAVWPGFTEHSFLVGIVGVAIFYGLPVSLVVRAMDRKPA